MLSPGLRDDKFPRTPAVTLDKHWTYGTMCEVLGFSNMPAASFPMKKKASITSSPEVLAQVRKLAGPKHSRSAVIEQSLRGFLGQRASGTELRDLELISDAADHSDQPAKLRLAGQRLAMNELALSSWHR
jgi:hypothetical protein